MDPDQPADMSGRAHELLVGLVPCERCSSESTLWHELIAQAGYCPVRYTASWINYQHTYVRALSEPPDLVQVALQHGGRPVALWSLAIQRQNGVWRIGTAEGAVRAPLFISDVGRSAQKKLIDSCQQALGAMASDLELSSWRTSSTSRGGGLDEWHRAAMERGGVVSVTHDLYVDLSLPIASIHGNLRKSYRPLVTKGRRLWQTAVYESAIPEAIFRDFQKLHEQVAGRVTRPQSTWDQQKSAIERGEAFLVTLRDPHDRLIGAGLFHRSPDEGIYAVGAYDRALFDLPVGHVVQMVAIEHMKDRGLRWYCIGQRPYPGDPTSPDDKLLSIGHFKEGFATHVFPQLDVTVPVSGGAP